MKLSLTPRAMVDISGAYARMAEDIVQLGLEPSAPGDRGGPPEGFKDLGLVEYRGEQFYASTYAPPSFRSRTEALLAMLSPDAAFLLDRSRVAHVIEVLKASLEEET